MTAELPEDPTPGDHAVEVPFQDMFKNSVLNLHFQIGVRE